MFERIFRDGGGDEERETKPHPQPFAFLVSQASRTATYGSPKREGVVSRGNGGSCLEVNWWY